MTKCKLVHINPCDYFKHCKFGISKGEYYSYRNHITEYADLSFSDEKHLNFTQLKDSSTIFTFS